MQGPTAASRLPIPDEIDHVSYKTTDQFMNYSQPIDLERDMRSQFPRIAYQ